MLVVWAVAGCVYVVSGRGEAWAAPWRAQTAAEQSDSTTGSAGRGAIETRTWRMDGLAKVSRSRSAEVGAVAASMNWASFLGRASDACGQSAHALPRAGIIIIITTTPPRPRLRPRPRPRPRTHSPLAVILALAAPWGHCGRPANHQLRRRCRARNAALLPNHRRTLHCRPCHCRQPSP